jgi:hypothetical protein
MGLSLLEGIPNGFLVVRARFKVFYNLNREYTYVGKKLKGFA